MSRLQTGIFVVGAIILLISPLPSLTARVSFADPQHSSPSQILSGAENFLVNQYNRTIGLVAEYPHSNMYWLYSDNFLASYVLQKINTSNVTQLKIAQNISRSLSRYLVAVPAPINQYMILNSSLFAFNTSKNYDVANIDGGTIAVTLNNGTSELNPKNYADIAFLEALYYNEIGQEDSALSVFQTGATMYDGIGMKDVPFSGVYQTYKLALYIYAAKVLGQNYSSSAETTLLNMQGINGGFFTGYNASYSTVGTLTNVETTSLSILAMTGPNQATQSQTTTSIIQNSNITTSHSAFTSSTTSHANLSISGSKGVPTSSSNQASSTTSSTSNNATSSSSSVSVIPDSSSSSISAFPYAVDILLPILLVLSLLIIIRKKKS